MVPQPRRGGGRLWGLRDLVAKQKTPGSQTLLLQDNKYISHALPGRATHRPPPKTQNAHEHLSTCYDSSNVLLPAHGLRRGKMNYSSLCAMMSVLCQPRPSSSFASPSSPSRAFVCTQRAPQGKKLCRACSFLRFQTSVTFAHARQFPPCTRRAKNGSRDRRHFCIPKGRLLLPPLFKIGRRGGPLSSSPPPQCKQSIRGNFCENFALYTGKKQMFRASALIQN